VSLPQLHAALTTCDAPLVKTLADALQAITCQSNCARTIRPNPHPCARSGVIADGCDAELDELRAIQTTAVNSCWSWKRVNARAAHRNFEREYNACMFLY